MRKLKQQVFLVIFLILTLFTSSVFLGFNLVNYQREYRSVERNLNETQTMGMKMLPPDLNNLPSQDNKGDFKPDNQDMDDIKFMDSTVYTVVLDEDNRIEKVINHSNNDLSDDEIKEIASSLIAQSSCKSIGNLFFVDYAYAFNAGKSIVIVDNASVKQELRTVLLYSALLYILLEVLIYLVATLLTRRITKPVAESFEKQKQFIADASHELKTPLAVIMASSDALENNPEETKWLQNIKSESERMNKLISDLLELAKSEETDSDTVLEIGNLSKLTEMSALTLEGLMFEKGLTLETEIEENIEMKMNSFKMKQLLSILLDNAMKHSEKNGTVTVKLYRDKDTVLLVQNRGEGIPKGEEEKIFERFYRADEARNRNENRYGLGLAIAKNIVTLHGGTISASSDNGLTTFKVVFKA